jgi:hypothetical protein
MKKLVITISVVIGLLVGADFAGAAVAEYKVSQQMQAQLHLADAPQVNIHGFPFLYQLAIGDFRDVQVDAQGLSVGQLSNVAIDAHLIHAHVPPANLLSGNAKTIQVDELQGSVQLTADDVGRFLGISDLTIAPAPKNTPGSATTVSSPDPTQTAVQLTGTVNIAGTNNKVSVIALLSLVNGRMKIQPEQLHLDNSVFGDIPLPAAFEQSLLQEFTTTIDPGSLPFKITPTAVSVGTNSLMVQGTAYNVTIGDDGLTTS